jgi:hypothetical protein
VMVAFEAAVGGGIPIIKAIREGLAAQPDRMAGRHHQRHRQFHPHRDARQGPRLRRRAQAEAQALGYAEADPTFDVEGIDAAHKLTILASIAFGIPLQFDKTYTEGITRITREDVAYAEELGYRIKHLGFARRTDKGVELRVHPTLIPERRLIANVDGVMNAVLVKGDAVGPTLYYGAGAGSEPTASAVVADLVDVVRALTADPGNRVPHLAFQPDALSDMPVLPMEEVETAYYLRMLAQDKPGVLADITRILGDRGISIEAIIQKEAAPEETERADHHADAPVREADEPGHRRASRRWIPSKAASRASALEHREMICHAKPTKPTNVGHGKSVHGFAIKYFRGFRGFRGHNSFLFMKDPTPCPSVPVHRPHRTLSRPSADSRRHAHHQPRRGQHAADPAEQHPAQLSARKWTSTSSTKA